MNASQPATPRRIWRVPLALAVCTAIALFIGLLYDGLWDALASIMLCVPVLCFGERLIRQAMR
jgi:hypothetical protein